MQFTINFTGKRESCKHWNSPHFAWLAVINGVSFEYNTGMGHCTPKYGKPSGARQSIWESERPNKRPAVPCIGTETAWVHLPQLDDILQCLFSDADAGSQSFNDFCDNFGYDNDSLKALDTYRACMESASKLRTALGKEYDAVRTRIESLNN